MTYVMLALLPPLVLSPMVGSVANAKWGWRSGSGFGWTIGTMVLTVLGMLSATITPTLLAIPVAAAALIFIPTFCLLCVIGRP